MHFVWWIAVGLVAGVLAKALVPGGRDKPEGCLLTILLGIAGSVLVGFVLHSVLHWQTGNHFIGTVVGATVGAIALIFLMRKVWQ